MDFHPASNVATEPPVQPRVQQEGLVIDARAGLTPSQLVERKLIGLLRGAPLPVSHLLSAARQRRPG
jgi:hypothetical protein